MVFASVVEDDQRRTSQEMVGGLFPAAVNIILAFALHSDRL